jgi:hypothetical protein
MALKPTAIISAALLAASAHAQSLLSLDDPAGDDTGDGSLVHPRDGVVAPGDLDLRQLRVTPEPGGLRIEATMANPIRNPSEARGGQLGSEDLSVFARRGFYAFNIDLYVDTDRVAGSGNSTGLPGRRLRFAAPFGWEKAIVLTPRPELMRRQLADALTESAPAAEVNAAIDASVHFVTDVRVRGRTVSFSVPKAFLDPAVVPAAAWVVTVTAAKLSYEVDVARLGRPAGRAVERLELGVAQPEAGRPAVAFGYRSDAAPPTSVVDLLASDATEQQAQLRQGVLTGLSRDNAFGAAGRTNAAAPLQAPSTPVPVAPIPATAGGSWFSRALDAIGSVFAGGAAAGTAGGAPSAAPLAAPPLQGLIDPPAAPRVAPAAPAAAAAAAAAPAVPAAAPPAIVVPPVVVVPAPAVPPAPAAAVAAPSTPAAAARGATPRPARDAAFYEEQEQRLRALQRLRERNLISEEEFQRKRKEIIDAL